NIQGTICFIALDPRDVGKPRGCGIEPLVSPTLGITHSPKAHTPLLKLKGLLPQKSIPESFRLKRGCLIRKLRKTFIPVSRGYGSPTSPRIGPLNGCPSLVLNLLPRPIHCHRCNKLVR